MIEAANRGGFAAQADFFAGQPINHGMSVTRDAVRVVLQDISDTFPDVRLELLNLVAEGDWVVARCDFVGTHLGVGRHPFVHEGLLAGVPPTGRSVRVQHIHMFRLWDGHIVEHWANRDDVGMIRQLGLSKRKSPAKRRTLQMPAVQSDESPTHDAAAQPPPVRA